MALSSVVHQNFNNLEIFVIKDGGEDVSDIIRSFDDPRIIFINRQENRGKAFSLNQALSRAQGKYIAYIDDDDLYYPNHIETLVGILEANSNYRAAYSDLYRTFCRVRPDGSREVLSKVLDISRDFDRFFMLCFNHTLHVSLMHTRELLEKTGLFNEQLNILVDWDLTRRLTFFTDFFHVNNITGEFYHPIGDSDRISVQRRKNHDEYLKNFLTIRTTRPPKPWSKIKDMSIILITNELDEQTNNTLHSICQYTFYPYQIYLPLLSSDIDKLHTDIPNIVTVPVAPNTSQNQRIDAALTKCDAEYIAVVPQGFPIRNLWVEDSLYTLINNSEDTPLLRQALELEDSTEKYWAVLIKKKDLEHALKSFPKLTMRAAIKAADITIRRVLPEEIPFQYDQLLQQAKTEQKNGNWLKAAQTFEYIAENYQNQLLIKGLMANAYFEAGRYEKANNLIHEVNQNRFTVDTLLLEAKLNLKKKPELAIQLLEKAEQILDFPSNSLWHQLQMQQQYI